jgi:O-antigen/teichoic acid export membrane protein
LSIKKLAGDTLWYGVPNIFNKFLSYFLNLILIWLFVPADTASINMVYAFVPFLNVLFTYGLETTFFRYVKDEGKEVVYNKLMSSILVSTVVFSIIIWLLAPYFAKSFKATDHPEFFYWIVPLLFFDTMSALPFALLRHEGRPKRYALAKMTNVILHLSLFLILLGVIPKYFSAYYNSPLLSWYDPTIKIGYYIIANIIAAFFTLIFLIPELRKFRWHWDGAFMKKVLKYTLPLLIVGLAGMVNELLSRVGYTNLAVGTDLEVRRELGIFSGNYRLVMLITIFIQAYRLAVEPFFFKKSNDIDAKENYARLMKYYVIASCVMYLIIVLFLPIWKHIITAGHQEYAEGLGIIPILAMGAVFLGIYYNQSVWYKLSDKNMYGAAITIGGAIITLVMNIILIPKYKYIGAAWANISCYIFMMIVSYFIGQKYYPVDYPLKKIGMYLGVSLGLYFLYSFLVTLIPSEILQLILGVVLLTSFIGFVYLTDKNELKKVLRR